jgi:hypothetical protein
MRRVATLVLVAVAVGGVVPIRAVSAQGEFHWKGTIPAGQTIEIKGVNGDVIAVAGTDAVEVTAVKSARRSDPEEVMIEVVPHGAGVTICAVYPSSGRETNSCEPADRGRRSRPRRSRDNDVRVDFTVHVPEGVRFVARTVNGSVEAANLASDVEANTVNGHIRVATSGYAEAETVNGSIVASLGRATWSDGLRFATVNGGITIDLPANVSADVRANTVNGAIVTDFPLTVIGRLGPRRLNGTIGSGGRRLELSTVNGSIRLRRNT